MSFENFDLFTGEYRDASLGEAVVPFEKGVLPEVTRLMMKHKWVTPHKVVWADRVTPGGSHFIHLTKGDGWPPLIWRGKTVTDGTFLWPTPAARDYKGANSAEHRARGLGHMGQLPNAVAESTEGKGQLNPPWVSWLMGFPLRWLNKKGVEG